MSSPCILYLYTFSYLPHFTYPARSPTIITPPSNMSVNEGDSVFLLCVARGLPSPSIKWFKEGDPSFGKFLPPSDWLTFESANEDTAGVYWCNASNVVNSSRVTVQSAPATVEVFSKLLCLLLIDIRQSSNGCRMFDCIPPSKLVDMSRVQRRLEASNLSIYTTAPLNRHLPCAR